MTNPYKIKEILIKLPEMPSKTQEDKKNDKGEADRIAHNQHNM